MNKWDFGLQFVYSVSERITITGVVEDKVTNERRIKRPNKWYDQFRIIENILI